MLDLVALIPALPLAGFLALVVGARMPRRAAAVVGVGSAGAAAVVALAVGWTFIASPPPDHVYVQTVWQWITVANLAAPVSFYLDPLSLVMVLVVTVVGFLILLYSAEYMRDDEAFSRFFAYMNLFVASMLVLVLAGNLLLLYLGWEGVGLCSYLLIGFWYKDPANARAAIKAFVVTRIGDVEPGGGPVPHLHEPRHARHPGHGPRGPAAVGPRLGAGHRGGGPDPGRGRGQVGTTAPADVAARRHGRPHAHQRPHPRRNHGHRGRVPGGPDARPLLARAAGPGGGGDHRRRDAPPGGRKRPGADRPQAGPRVLDHQPDRVHVPGAGRGRVGRRHLPLHDARVLQVAPLPGGGRRHHRPARGAQHAADGRPQAPAPRHLLGLPRRRGVAGGRAAGDRRLLLEGPHPCAQRGRRRAADRGSGPRASSGRSSPRSIRSAWCSWCSSARRRRSRRGGRARPWASRWPCWRSLSIIGGLVDVPAWLGGRPIFTDFLAPSLPPTPEGSGGPLSDSALATIAAAVSLAGILVAYLLFMPGRAWTERLAARGPWSLVRRWWLAGWGFDWLYDGLLVRPLVWAARVNRADFIDAFYAAVAWTSRALNSGLVMTQNGQVRWYAMALAAGAVIILAIVVLGEAMILVVADCDSAGRRRPGVGPGPARRGVVAVARPGGDGGRPGAGGRPLAGPPGRHRGHRRRTMDGRGRLAVDSGPGRPVPPGDGRPRAC